MKTINDIIDMCFDSMDCNTCFNYCVCGEYMIKFTPLLECAMAITAINCIDRGLY